MSDYRELSTDEIKGLTTLNVCANAIRDSLPMLGKRFKRAGQEQKQQAVEKLADEVAGVVDWLVHESEDEDQQKMVMTRMSRLKLQFGSVRKHPESLVMMTTEDAQTLLAPVLDKCDLECPCVEYAPNGDRVVIKSLVKACETRKALKRIGLAEVGLSMDCPYMMMLGGKD